MKRHMTRAHQRRLRPRVGELPGGIGRHTSPRNFRSSRREGCRRRAETRCRYHDRPPRLLLAFERVRSGTGAPLPPLLQEITKRNTIQTPTIAHVRRIHPAIA
jgi:hypothetical protein